MNTAKGMVQIEKGYGLEEKEVILDYSVGPNVRCEPLEMKEKGRRDTAVRY